MCIRIRARMKTALPAFVSRQPEQWALCMLFVIKSISAWQICVFKFSVLAERPKHELSNLYCADKSRCAFVPAFLTRAALTIMYLVFLFGHFVCGVTARELFAVRVPLFVVWSTIELHISKGTGLVTDTSSGTWSARRSTRSALSIAFCTSVSIMRELIELAHTAWTHLSRAERSSLIWNASDACGTCWCETHTHACSILKRHHTLARRSNNGLNCGANWRVWHKGRIRFDSTGAMKCSAMDAGPFRWIIIWNTVTYRIIIIHISIPHIYREVRWL